VSLKRLGLLLLGPLFLGAGLRFTHAWSCFHSRTPHALPQWAYYETGLGLLSYKTYTPDIVNLQPKAWRGPLFPAFIALAESLWKHPLPGHVYLAQALLSTSAIPLAFALGCLLVSPLAGFWASLWMALDFGQIASVTSLNVHGFYSLCILALAACLALWAEKPGWKASALCGLCLGASLLCRTAHYLLIGLLPLAAVFWSWDLRQGLRRASLLAFFAALCLAPFLLRRQDLPPVHASSGYRFEMGRAEELRPGNEAALFATGGCVHNALLAAELLARKGISASVSNFGTLMPADARHILEAGSRAKVIATVEDHSPRGGLGSKRISVGRNRMFSSLR